jgi:hypothetical protein
MLFYKFLMTLSTEIFYLGLNSNSTPRLSSCPKVNDSSAIISKLDNPLLLLHWGHLLSMGILLLPKYVAHHWHVSHKMNPGSDAEQSSVLSGDS